MAAFRTDMILNGPEKVRDGNEIWIFVPTANIPVTINHNLAKRPLRCVIVDKDKSCDFYRSYWDRNQATLVFTAAQVNLVLRFE